MHIIEIIVEKDRSVKCEEIYGGINGENSVTELKFVIPKEYKNFYKYLDILKSDGVKTQTVVGDLEKDIFYYTLPFSLTKEKEIVIQLVLKSGKKVFMSNMISLYFNDSLNATGVIDDNYQDTIEFIMENKTDHSFSEELSKEVKNKAEKLDVYNLDLKVNNLIKEKADNLDVSKLDLRVSNLASEKTNYSDFVNFKENVQSALGYKVDKIYGKELSDENYTTKEKEKLNKLPSKEEIDQRINYIDLGVLDEFDIDYLPKVNKVQEIAVSEGVYHIKWAFDEIMGITDYAADGLLFKTMFYGEPALYLYVNGTNYYCKGAQDIWIRANVGNIIDLGEAEITGYNFPLEDFERIMSEKYSQFTRKSGVYQIRWTLTMSGPQQELIKDVHTALLIISNDNALAPLYMTIFYKDEILINNNGSWEQLQHLGILRDDLRYIEDALWSSWYELDERINTLSDTSAELASDVNLLKNQYYDYTNIETTLENVSNFIIALQNGIIKQQEDILGGNI